MKRPIAIIGVGVLLLFILVVAVSGKRATSDVKAPAKTERQASASQKTFAIDHAVKPTAGLTDSDTETAVTATASERTPDETDAHDIPWHTIDAGGEPATSTNYKLNGSVGQHVIGYCASGNHQSGMGYWYGMGGDDCNCSIWGDVTGDGNINPVDVVFMVNRVYLGNDMTIQHPNCPRDAADINCDGNVNPVDVVFFVNKVYLNNDMFCADPCS